MIGTVPSFLNGFLTSFDVKQIWFISSKGKLIMTQKWEKAKIFRNLLSK